MCDGTSHAPTTCPPVSDQLKSDAARRTPLDLSNSSTTLENNYASNPAPRNAKVKKSRNTTRQVAQLDVSFSKARRQAQVGKEMKPVEKVAKTESQPKSSQPKKGLTLPELELKRERELSRLTLLRELAISWICSSCAVVFDNKSNYTRHFKSAGCLESSVRRHDPMELPREGSFTCCGEQGVVNDKGVLDPNGGCGQVDCIHVLSSGGTHRKHVELIQFKVGQSLNRLSNHNPSAVVGLHCCDGIVCGDPLCTWYYAREWDRNKKLGSSAKLRATFDIRAVARRFVDHLSYALERLKRKITLLRCLAHACSDPANPATSLMHIKLIRTRADRLVAQLQMQYYDILERRENFKSDNGMKSIRTKFIQAGPKNRSGANLSEFPPILVDALSDNRCVDCGTRISPRWKSATEKNTKCQACYKFPKNFVTAPHKECVRCDCVHSYAKKNSAKGGWDEPTGLCIRCFHYLHPLPLITGGPCIDCKATVTTDEWRNGKCNACSSKEWRNGLSATTPHSSNVMNSGAPPVASTSGSIAPIIRPTHSYVSTGLMKRAKTVPAAEYFALDPNKLFRPKIKLRDPFKSDAWIPENQLPPPTSGPLTTF